MENMRKYRYCEVCNDSFSNGGAWKAHLKSQRHEYNVFIETHPCHIEINGNIIRQFKNRQIDLNDYMVVGPKKVVRPGWIRQRAIYKPSYWIHSNRVLFLLGARTDLSATLRELLAKVV